ncbi:MAG: (4Fe-4S)-binding protein [Propionibacteriaceae bacterium]|jgi:uncharacterized Fe-S cluster protein YjdI|nr:(4Fe-4S)-binding protein [Propionibacteriaceae bacterium]
MARRTYTGSKIDVTFDFDVCQHSGRCIRGLPAVFEVGRKPWILPDAGDPQAVADVIDTCPSGALEYIWHDQPAPATP